MTFDGEELYIEIESKAAALIESLLTNHPFNDGNKRIGYVLMRMYLLNNNLDIVATEEEKYGFVIKAAAGEIKFSEIRDWIKDKTKIL